MSIGSGSTGSESQPEGSEQPVPTPFEDIMARRGLPSGGTIPVRFLELYEVDNLPKTKINK